MTFPLRASQQARCWTLRVLPAVGKLQRGSLPARKTKLHQRSPYCFDHSVLVPLDLSLLQDFGPLGLSLREVL